jgi:hypothetical protein
MIASLLLLVGCQQDLLLLGDVTGLASAGTTTRTARLPPAPEPVPAEAPTAEVAAAEVAAAEVPPAAGSPAEEIPAVAPPSPTTFNPISIPEGPREGDGVRWEGVKVKGRGSPGGNVRTRTSVDGVPR